MEILGAVAAGSVPTAEAAAAILRAGGNAFDAAVAAGFAATATEPILASLGGGGFLLARTAAGEEVLVDFFVAMPGRSGQRHDPDAMEAVPIHFGPAVQVFHVGESSVAVPGMLAGLLHVAQRFGRLDLGDVVAPAVGLAEAGVAVDEVFARVLGLVWPILEGTDEGQAMFGREGRALRPGERFVCPELAATLAEVAAGRRLSMAAEELGGGITDADVDGYRVVEREPLRAPYRDAVVVTNPPPSFGGSLVAHGLDVLSGPGQGLGSAGQLGVVEVADALRSMADRRNGLGPGVSKGTTHVSVADAEGNVAAMSVSNGSGSGEFAAGTGVQLNNMLGEEDLQPGGLGSVEPGERIGSMMAPMFVETAGGGVVAAGSGGSERIRSALLQLTVDLVDRGMGVEGAVLSPRGHWDGSVLQVEGGLRPDLQAALEAWGPVNGWPGRDFYFGGVHAVGVGGALGWTAAGDPRRGGVGLVVRPE